MAASRYLHEIREKRAIREASRSGRSQIEIAEEVDRSQPTISRMLRQATADPAVLNRLALEVVAEAAAGLQDRESMMSELASMDLSSGVHAPDGLDGYVPGPWDDVINAWGRGWLSDEEYERLATN